MKSIPISLSGKVAVVTGGASGIGEAMARTFARAGATSVIADLDEKRGSRVARAGAARGDRIWFWKTDVTSEDAVESLFTEVKRRSKRLDILVCNAAWMSPQMYKPFVEQPLAEWDRTLDINFRGTMLCCKAALPMLEKHRGNIIGVCNKSPGAPPNLRDTYRGNGGDNNCKLYICPLYRPWHRTCL